MVAAFKNMVRESDLTDEAKRTLAGKAPAQPIDLDLFSSNHDDDQGENSGAKKLNSPLQVPTETEIPAV